MVLTPVLGAAATVSWPMFPELVDKFWPDKSNTTDHYDFHNYLLHSRQDAGSSDKTRTRRRFVRKPPRQQPKEAIGKSEEEVNMHTCPEYQPCKTCKPDEA